MTFKNLIHNNPCYSPSRKMRGTPSLHPKKHPHTLFFHLHTSKIDVVSALPVCNFNTMSLTSCRVVKASKSATRSFLLNFDIEHLIYAAISCIMMFKLTASVKNPRIRCDLDLGSQQSQVQVCLLYRHSKCGEKFPACSTCIGEKWGNDIAIKINKVITSISRCNSISSSSYDWPGN